MPDEASGGRDAPWLEGPETVGRELKKDELNVVRIFMSGQKQTVVEREQNILSSDEAQQHEKACTQAMYYDIMRWHTLGAFKRMPRKLATNVIDARWVLKWKLVAGKRIIQARLVVRGFKDLQAAQLSTFAGTTSRWGQRIVNSVAVQRGWQLFTADVSQAFLRGLTFEEAAKIKDEVHRSIQFTMPPGSVPILQRVPGYSDFNAIAEVLEMLRCGFGLKDAPRLWNKVLRALLEDIGMRPLQSDEQLFVWHETNGRSDAPSSSKASDTEVFAPTLRMILSTHVDDMKGGRTT